MSLRLGNDTPVWFKPRRTVWFVLKDGKVVEDRAGRYRLFRTEEQAARLLARMDCLAGRGQ